MLKKDLGLLVLILVVGTVVAIINPRFISAANLSNTANLIGLFGLFAIGMIAAFVSAFICIRWLLRYVATHDFTAFAWYRIGFGLLILIVGYSGGLSWAD